jgi:transposase
VLTGGDPRAQTAMFALDIRQMLPADHPALYFIEMVGKLDLSGFKAAYRADGVGRPPYDPGVMLTLILYCRSKRLMSSRQVAGACHDDLGARLITGNRYPSRKTVNSFLDIHGAAIRAVLPQILRLGYAADLVDVSVVAGDGTYVLANAAMEATVDEAGLLAQIADLERQLDAAQQEWLKQVGDEVVEQPPSLLDDLDDLDDLSDRPGRAGRSTAAWRRVCTLDGKLRSRQAALTHLRAHPNTDVTEWQERLDRDQKRVERCTDRVERTRATVTATYDKRAGAEAAGARIPGTRPVPVEEHVRVRQARQALDTATARAAATAANRPTTDRVNTTDPVSAIMPGKHDGYDQRHNVQALSCPNQFVLAVGTHPSTNDKRAMVDLLLKARANLDAAGITDPIGAALFDSGYASAPNFTADVPVELLLVSVTKEARQTGRRKDDDNDIPAPWQDMAVRLAEPENSKLYKRRGAIIEPLFAQWFARFGRSLNARDAAVETELHLWAITHNLLKISRARQRTRPPG